MIPCAFVHIQVTERLFELDFTVYVASFMCSAAKKDVRAALDPRIHMLACGKELTQ